ncbi:MAG TPA: MFS transporter [Armatimonadota bacterium]|nr:MFS transporter [Armatimonadota bacterium]
MPTVSYVQLVRENRNFRLYWGGQIVSQLGDWFSIVTVQVLLLKYTGAATSIALFLVAQMLPLFLLGPVAGVLVDRLPRKAVMIGADVARALIALGLLGLRGPETVWVAFACIAGISTFSAFFEPARMAVLPNITSDEELVTANALSSVTWSILLTSGALVGGLVSRFFGAETAFVLNSLSFVGSALFLVRLRVPESEHKLEHARGIGELIAGFRYVREHSQILATLTAKLGWGLAGGIQGLLPIYAQKRFPLPNDPNGELSLGVLLAAGGVGTAMGPVLARRFTGREIPRIRWAIAVSFVMGGIYYACMAAAPNLSIAALFLLLARTHGAVVWVFSTVLLQMLVEDRYRGRVFAAEASLFTATMMLSNLGATRALDLRWAGVPQVTFAMGVISLVVGLFWIARLARAPIAAPETATPRPPSEPGREEAAE